MALLFTVDVLLCITNRLLQVRGRMYELLIHCIPPEVIIKVIIMIMCVCVYACVCVCVFVYMYMQLRRQVYM